MALADPLREEHGPAASSCPANYQASPLYFPPRLGRALYPARDPMALQSLPEVAHVPPRREARGCGRAGGRVAPRGGRPAGPPAGDRRGQGAGKAPPERPRRPHRCAARRADSGGPPPPAPGGRTARFPGNPRGDLCSPFPATAA